MTISFTTLLSGGLLRGGRVGLRVLALAALGLGTSVRAAEEGGESPAPRWMLTMEHGRLRTADVRTSEGARTHYHYLTLEITNPTELPRPFYPMVRAVTDTKKTVLAGSYPEALGPIRSQERQSNLISIADVQGKIQPGETKSLVAIFGTLDPAFDEVQIQVHGLVDPIALYRIEIYGDVEIVCDAVYFERNQKLLKTLRAEAAGSGGELPAPRVEVRRVQERRFFEMIYRSIGDEYSSATDPITFVREGWATEGDLKVLAVVWPRSEDEGA